VFQALDSINGGVPTVTWRVTGGGAGTYMSTTNNGELFVGQGETAAYLTLRAEMSGGRYGTAVITVGGEAEETAVVIPAEVSGIRVTPGIISLARGSSGTKFAALGPEGNGVTGVSWTLETGGGSPAAGTGVTGEGELDIAAAEALSCLIVRAESGVDYGTAVVYVGDTGESHPVDGGITVYPAGATVPAGGFADFIARLSGTETGAPVWWWSLDTPDAEGGTGITGDGGRLTVSEEEDAGKTLVVRAITADGKYGTAVVSVTDAVNDDGPGVGVTEVRVSPASVTVRRGEGQTFSAYDGQNTTPVTWSVSGGGQGGGTAIGADGVLSVGANETAAGLTVRAVSAENTDIYGEAAVYVPTVYGVTVNETGETVPKGSSRQFTATVDAAGGAATTVEWSVETPGVNGGTGFTGNTLYVASGETAASITIRATSAEDDTKYGEAAVTVPQPLVSGVTVSPPVTSVAKGNTRQFTATVYGTGGISQEVTWSVANKNSAGTVISGAGLLTVASDETAVSLTVRAASVADGTKYGDAAVTVPAVSGVTVNPSAASVAKGNTRQFTATVEGTADISHEVTWSVTGGHGGTGISTDGLLTVASDETAASLTVRATSVADTTKYGTAAVTVPTVSGVTVSPSTASVARGNTQTFSATVTGTGGPSQAVTWSVSNKNSAGTAISGGGLLTVASDETAASLTVRATSVADTTKYGTAEVTPVSGTKDITGFSIKGIEGAIKAGGRTVTVTFPYGTPVTSLSPLITHNGAGVSPASGAAQDFTNPVTYTVTAEDNSTAVWTVTVSLGPLDTIALIDTYLSGVSGGESAASPIPLPVALNLPDADQGWAVLLSKIQEKGKFVALDLSACAMAGTEFDPGGADTGERRIASLVLPAPATSVKAGTSGSPTFRNFTALKNVSGANVTAVGGLAFRDCAALATVNLPEATGIGSFAFYNCGALETVNLPKAAIVGVFAFQSCAALATVSLPAATGIGNYAFAYCAALATVDMPAAASIGNYAFYDCDALATLELPVAASIGSRAFASCSALATLNIPAVTSVGVGAFLYTGGQALTITMGQAAPSVSASGDNASSTFSKNVTIRTPASPAGYGDTWQTNFRKAFGVSYGSYTVTINLNFETITQ
jgi:hypothetical protein